MRVLTTILFLFLICSAIGQHQDTRNYKVEDGLPQISVKCFNFDERKLMWIGTIGGGCATFDGHEFRKIELPSNDLNVVNYIVKDSEGDFIIGGNSRDVVHVSGSSFKILEFKASVEFNGTTDACRYVDKVVLATNRGLYQIIDNQIDVLEVSGLPRRRINHLSAYDENSALLVSQGTMVYKVKDNRVVDTLKFSSNVSQAIEFNSTIYVNTYDSLYIIKGETVSHCHHLENINLITSDENYLYVDADGAQYYFDESAVLHTVKSNVKLTKTWCMQSDNDGNIWIGSHADGLVQIIQNGYTSFSSDSKAGTTDIFCMEEYEGLIYFASIKEGIHTYNPDSGEIKHIPFLNEESVVSYDFETHNNTLYVTTGKGLYKLENNLFVSADTKFKLPKNQYIRSMLSIGSRVYFAVVGQGVYEYDVKKDAVTRPFDNKINFAHDMIYDSKNRLWVGAGDGAYVFDRDTMMLVNKQLCNTYAGSLCEDKHGRIYIGTDKCLSVWDDGKVYNFTEEDGLNSSTIYLVGIDAQQNVVVGTNKGLNRLTLGDDGEINEIVRIGRDQGFKGIECNSRSYLLTKKNIEYVGTSKGIMIYNHKKAINSNAVCTPYISAIDLFLKPTSWDDLGVKTNKFNIPQNLNLEHDQNHITFKFNAVDYVAGKHLQYQYKLLGFDKDWSPLSEYNQAVYANLPEGKYTFKVRAIQHDGTVCPEIQSGEITVNAAPPPPPPVYKTWWFWTLISIPIIMFLYYQMVIKTKQLRMVKDQLESLVEIRTAEISRQNDEKEVMLKEIHHRVKNNLQIINSLLNLQAQDLSDEASLASFEECKNRVNSMALIHERLYEAKDLSHIKFKKYTQDLADKLISSYSHSSDIELGIDIDEEYVFNMDTLVPLGIILNELISNSIKYAFKGVDSPLIKVSLKKNLKENVLTVSDNGVGLPNDFNWRETESLGMQLVQILSEQIDGEIKLIETTGTCFELRFSLV